MCRLVLPKIILSLSTIYAYCEANNQFPDGFLFGAATSAYQIEGAWNVSDKTENMWDFMTHNNQIKIDDGSNGDIATDSYHQYKRDVAMLKEIGMDFYRFSLSWTRLLPTGYPNKISEDGKRYYNNLIDELIKNGIKPMVTIYHYDLPLMFHEFGGWLNPMIVDWFADFANVAFSLFADRVKYWITINEPLILCDFGYGNTVLAPALNESGFANYICSKNILVAHAKAWRIFDEKYKPKYGGLCSIANQVVWSAPSSNSNEDIEAAEDSNEYIIGRFHHPVFSKQGGWPSRLEEKIAARSKAQGFRRSRLPPFTEEEKALVKGTFDFCAINHYTTWSVKRVVRENPRVDADEDLDIQYGYLPESVDGEIFWFKLYPIGFRKSLDFIKRRYNNPHIIITENGYGSLQKGLNDDRRLNYYKAYIEQLLLAIHEDGCNITHYTAWSLMDNFEWQAGYSVRFGLFEVDYDDPERSVKPRKSALYFKDLIQSKTLDPNWEPQIKIEQYLSTVYACCEANNQFPDGFLFGTATSAYQIEGAWNVSDKTENIWDHMTHNNQVKIDDGSNGDIATDSYHQYKRDVAMLNEIGIDFYRFSLSWTRLLPTGYPNKISEDGKRYYNNLIDELIKNGIKPMVTIYHWDLPLVFHEYGGWLNPMIVDWFADFANVVFSLFADRVKYWITINEPLIICDFGYGNTVLAPALNQSGSANYIYSKNVLVAHAKAWRIFDEKYRPKYGGLCSCANHVIWSAPSSSSNEDIEAAEDSNEYIIGRFHHPVFSKQGGWPSRIEDKIAARSKAQGFRRSRLPPFTEEEKALVKGTFDFCAINHYTTWSVKRVVRENPRVDAAEDLDIQYGYLPESVDGEIFWFKVYPIGFRKSLNFLKRRYNNPHIIITENGYGSLQKGLNDDTRLNYYKAYLEQLLLAIHEDGCNITHYTAWSLMDNFEWQAGYSVRFGLFEVDYDDPERSVKPRKSALFFKDLIQSKTLDPNWEPQTKIEL